MIMHGSSDAGDRGSLVLDAWALHRAGEISHAPGSTGENTTNKKEKTTLFFTPITD